MSSKTINKNVPVCSIDDVTHPVWLDPGQKRRLGEPPQAALVSRLGENQSSLPIFALLINVQRADASAVHVVPQLDTSSFS